NVKARMRMIAQFELAGEKRLLVVGTDHAAEAVTGFFTKFGDGAADVVPLAGLNKRQGRALMSQLGAPDHLIAKAPTADLLDDEPRQTDESYMGLSYEQIDDFLEGRVIEAAAASALIETYIRTDHQRRITVTPTASVWFRHCHGERLRRELGDSAGPSVAESIIRPVRRTAAQSVNGGVPETSPSSRAVWLNSQREETNSSLRRSPRLRASV